MMQLGGGAGGGGGSMLPPPPASCEPPAVFSGVTLHEEDVTAMLAELAEFDSGLDRALARLDPSQGGGQALKVVGDNSAASALGGAAPSS